MKRWGLAILLSAALATPLAAQERPTIGDLYQEANAAYTDKDAARFLKAMKALIERRPYSMPLRRNLARAYVMAGETAAAMAVLTQMADEGLFIAITAAGDFAPLADAPSFETLRQRLLANGEPQGSAEIVAEFAGEAVQLSEGIALDGETAYLSMVRSGRILNRADNGSVTELLKADEDNSVGGLYALALHDGALYAASNATPPYAGPQDDRKPNAAVLKIDPQSGTVTQVLEPPADADARRLIGEVKFSQDGVLYATDSFANVIYKAAPGAEGLSVLTLSTETTNLQGLALLDDKTGVVADYHLGLLRVDLETGEAAPLGHPKSLNPSGTDGLYAAGPRTLIAVQNGLSPHRILKLTLNEAQDAITGAQVLASNLAEWDEPTLGAVQGGKFYYNAVSQWGAWDGEGTWRDGYRMRDPRIMVLDIE